MTDVLVEGGVRIDYNGDGDFDDEIVEADVSTGNIVIRRPDGATSTLVFA